MNRSPLPEDRHTIAKILSKKNLERPLLTKISGSKPKAMLILLDYLSRHERQIVENIPHPIIDLEDDLLKKIVELEEENARLRSQALIDGLTGLYNNRFFRLQLETEMARTRRTGLSCCLLMIDLDNFKMINDTRGHLEGDRFLAQTAQTFSQCVRAVDIVCRYGGDEFVAILPSTRQFVAIRIANRFKNAVREIPGATGYNVSASIGIAEFTVSSPWDENKFIQSADFAMYEAKSKGGNQVCTTGYHRKIDGGLEPVSIQEKDAISSIRDSEQGQGERDGA
ncbi:MAG: GGDEF domain-containing protein [Syntrophorhabdus sp.]|nr:GGDEF domain-containing protein [Syntrophorhabdus sp.]